MAEDGGNIVDFQRARGIAEAEALYRRAEERMYRGELDHLIDWAENVDTSQLSREATPWNNAVDTPLERGLYPYANDNGVRRQGC